MYACTNVTAMLTYELTSFHIDIMKAYFPMGGVVGSSLVRVTLALFISPYPFEC